MKREYRQQLEGLRDKTFLVEALVGKRRLRKIDNQFGGFKLRTMCLNDVKCAIKSELSSKYVLKAKVDHTWVCESLSKIVRDKSIQEGHVIRFFARVEEYTYADGTKQLGLVQCNDKQYKIIN